MVHCLAAGCNHESTKAFAHLKLGWHKVPAGKLGKAWRDRIGRTHYPKEQNLCSDHFTKDDYLRDMKNELLGQPTRKILKPDAVPSIFLHKLAHQNPVKRRLTSERRSTRKQQKMMVEDMLHKSLSPSSSAAATFSSESSARNALTSTAATSFSSGSTSAMKALASTTAATFSSGATSATNALASTAAGTFSSDSTAATKALASTAAGPSSSGSTSATKALASTSVDSFVIETDVAEFVTYSCCDTCGHLRGQDMISMQTLTKDNTMTQGTQTDCTEESSLFFTHSTPIKVSGLPTGEGLTPPIIYQETSANTMVQTPLTETLSINETYPLASNYDSNQSLVESLDDSKCSIPPEADDPKDPNYSPNVSVVESLDDSNCSIPEQDTPIWQDVVEQKKFIVFEKCLEQLLQRCQKCGKPITSKSINVKGGQVIVKADCLGHCDIEWRSSPVINKMAAVNFLLSASVLFSGNSYSKIAQIAKHMNLAMITKQQFSKVQKKLLFPVIWDTWLEEEQRVLNILKEQEQVVLAGDGRFDSAGYNAKYGSYTLMDTSTDLIAGFKVVQVTDVTSSQAMEKEGFRLAIDHILDEGVKVDTVATDRHPNITAIIRDKYPHLKHQYDVWHFAKSLIKELTKAAKKKGCEDLFPWISSIVNHLWWSASSCGGDARLLKEMYMSVLHHITNEHEWTGYPDDKFTSCAHSPLSNEDERKTKWLIPGSPAHEALKDVIFNKRLLKALPGLKDFRHTGQLEVFHSLLLKYCSKRQHFSAAGMNARHALAVIDNNHNIGRCQAVTKDGKPRGNVVFAKAKKDWVYKPIKEKKSYTFVDVMMVKVGKRQMAGGTDTLDDILPHRPKNIAPGNKPKPSKSVMYDSHRSRFSKSKNSQPEDSSSDEE